MLTIRCCLQLAHANRDYTLWENARVFALFAETDDSFDFNISN